MKVLSINGQENRADAADDMPLPWVTLDFQTRDGHHFLLSRGDILLLAEDKVGSGHSLETDR
jgi:hypothetical protein